MTPDFLKRSEQDLAAAELLIERGFYSQAISRSYYAALYAAEGTIVGLGEIRKSHAGVISAFTKVVIKERGLDPETGELLRALFGRRLGADYTNAEPAADDARRALSDAKRFVELVREWLAR